jgi:hypothetical protein
MVQIVRICLQKCSIRILAIIGSGARTGSRPGTRSSARADVASGTRSPPDSVSDWVPGRVPDLIWVLAGALVRIVSDNQVSTCTYHYNISRSGHVPREWRNRTLRRSEGQVARLSFCVGWRQASRSRLASTVVAPNTYSAHHNDTGGVFKSVERYLAPPGAADNETE